VIFHLERIFHTFKIEDGFPLQTGGNDGEGWLSEKGLDVVVGQGTGLVRFSMVEKWLRRVTCSWMCKMERISMHHVFSVIWFSLEMHDGQDVNFYCRVLIDNSKRESMKEKTTGAVRVDWPGLWCVLNPRDSELNFLKECFASSFSLLVIPVLCLFKFSEGLIMEDDGKVSSHELSGV
jgi:hypothetical protein